jgi:hypothetical protein
MPRPLKYTGSRVDQYEFVKVFLADDKVERNKAIEFLNKKENAARKRAETIARKKKEAEEEARFIEQQKKLLEKERREEEARKKKEQREAKRRQKKAVAFEALPAWVSKFIGNPDLPFRLRLNSAIANVSRTFNFKSLQHFLNWFAAVEQQNVKSESENYELISDIIGNEDVFNLVVPDFLEVAGGCNYHGKDHITKETAFYTFELYNPKSQHNDCGFKI